jgi:hypothetical protein
MIEDSQVDNDLMGLNERFAGRLDMVRWLQTSTEAATATAFDTAYRTASGQDAASLSESLYDSFYENAYALQSVLDSNGNTTLLFDPSAYAAAVIGFNAPGQAVTVGPSNIATTFPSIANKVDIDLDGASGPLEFDSTAGSPVQDAELRCFKANGTTSTASGVTFNGATGVATGTYTCL